MTASLLTNSSKTKLLLIGLKTQLAKTHNSSLETSHSARNLSCIFGEHLTFSYQITPLSPKPVYYHIRQLHRIRPYLDSSTACTIATSIVHSKLDYCNSVYYNSLSLSSPADPELSRSYVKAPKSCHITPIYTLFTGSESLNASNTTIPGNLISVQRPRTRSSSVVTLARPPTSHSLRRSIGLPKGAISNFKRLS